MSTTWVM